MTYIYVLENVWRKLFISWGSLLILSLLVLLIWSIFKITATTLFHKYWSICRHVLERNFAKTLGENSYNYKTLPKKNHLLNDSLPNECTISPRNTNISCWCKIYVELLTFPKRWRSFAHLGREPIKLTGPLQSTLVHLFHYPIRNFNCLVYWATQRTHLSVMAW